MTNDKVVTGNLSKVLRLLKAAWLNPYGIFWLGLCIAGSMLAKWWLGIAVFVLFSFVIVSYAWTDSDYFTKDD